MFDYEEKVKKNRMSLLKILAMFFCIAIIVVGCLEVFSGLSSTDEQSKSLSNNKEPFESKATEKINLNPSYDLKVRQLEKEYENNAISAQQKYGSQIIAVEGYIRDIDTDFLGNPYITIGSSIDEWDFGYVQCMFNNENDLVSVSINNRVKVKGKVDSESFSTLTMKECSFLDLEK